MSLVTWCLAFLFALICWFTCTDHNKDNDNNIDNNQMIRADQCWHNMLASY